MLLEEDVHHLEREVRGDVAQLAAGALVEQLLGEVESLVLAVRAHGAAEQPQVAQAALPRVGLAAVQRREPTQALDALEEHHADRAELALVSQRAQLLLVLVQQPRLQALRHLVRVRAHELGLAREKHLARELLADRW